MTLLGRLAQRRCQPEIMDDPGLDVGFHAQALRALARINWLSGSARIVWRPLQKLAREMKGGSLRVLDIATGGGDVPIYLWKRARRFGLSLEIHATDISATALDIARQNARRAQADVQFFQRDITRDGIPPGFDVVTCSLFLHHQSPEDAPELLRRMRHAAGRMLLVNDLRRCRLGYALAWLGTRLLTRSPVVHVDGPRSVEAAFSLDEIRALARQTGLDNAEISRHWPCRFLLTWRRP